MDPVLSHDVTAGACFLRYELGSTTVTRRTVCFRYVWIESAGLWVARGGEMDFTILAPDIFFRKLKKYHCNRKFPPYQLQYRPVISLLVPRQPYHRSTVFSATVVRSFVLGAE